MGKRIINCLARDPIKLIKLVNLIKKKMKSKSVFEIQKKKFLPEKKLKEENNFRFMTLKKSLQKMIKLFIMLTHLKKTILLMEIFVNGMKVNKLKK